MLAVDNLIGDGEGIEIEIVMRIRLLMRWGRSEGYASCESVAVLTNMKNNRRRVDEGVGGRDVGVVTGGAVHVAVV